MSETTNIHSISTMATWPLYDELVLLIRSLRAFHPNIPLFILTQHKVAQQLAVDNLLDNHIAIIIGLEKFGLAGWRNNTPKNRRHFLAHKALAMKAALMQYPNTLFLDSDMLILAPLPRIDETKDLGLHNTLASYHVYRSDPNPSHAHSQNNEIKTWRYTAGWIFVNHSKFPHQYWQTIHKIQSDLTYEDQIALVELTDSFSHFLFPISSHIHPFLFTTRHKWLLRFRQLKSHPILSYRNKPIGAIHVHFFSQSGFGSLRVFWLYLLYKNHSPWFNYINDRSDAFRYNPAELKKQFFFSLAFIIRYMAFHGTKYVTLTHKQCAYKKTDISYYLIRIYRHLIFLYYLTLETLYLYHVIRKSEFAISRCKLFIITFGWTYGRTIKRKFRKNLLSLTK